MQDPSGVRAARGVEVSGGLMGELKRDQYPELDKILWDFFPRVISADAAFNMYESRWGFVDRKRMTKAEKKLITQLVAYVGHGFFMPAR